MDGGGWSFKSPLGKTFFKTKVTQFSDKWANHEYYSGCQFDEQASWTNDTDRRCFGDSYVHHKTSRRRWFLTESNCPNQCDTGVCGQIPYTTEYSSISQFSDQYTCTTSNQATGVTCPSGKELFEVSCTVSDGFDIRINESCRKSYFSFIDFGSSFLWGDQTKSQMDTPLGSTGVDVDQSSVSVGINEYVDF